MTAEEFLKSTEAELAIEEIQELQTALAGTYDETRAFYLERNILGPWQCIEFEEVHGDASVEVDYRPAGAGYLAPDRGNPVRPLRLRTGGAGALGELARRQPPGLAAQVDHCRLLGLLCTDGVMRWHGPAEGLTRAIRNTLLDAHRVASLEVPR